MDIILHESLPKWSQTNKTLKWWCWRFDGGSGGTTLLNLGPRFASWGPLFLGHTHCEVFNVRTEVKRSSTSVRGAYHGKCEAKPIC